MQRICTLSFNWFIIEYHKSQQKKTHVCREGGNNMPGYLTHCLYGQKVVPELKNNIAKTYILNHKRAFYLGTQGPDIFFYYIPNNITSKNKLGSIMHRQRVGSFFEQAINTITSISCPAKKEVAFSYFSGFLCHYMLDSTTHPYVYAMTHYNPNIVGTFSDTALHCEFESTLDANMLYHLKGKLPSEAAAYRYIHANRKELHQISLFLSRSITSTYQDANFATPRFVLNAMRSIIREVRFLSTGPSVKRKILSIIEKNTLRCNLITCLMPTDNLYPEKDVLNLKRKSWSSPWRPSQKNTTTFPEIFHQSIPKCAQLIDQLMVLCYLSPCTLGYKKALNRCLEQIGSLSYNTGLIT